MRTGIYRVRKSFWGKCILQELFDSPVKEWQDVKWNQAPGVIIEDVRGYDKLYSNTKGDVFYEPGDQETMIDFIERMRGF